MIENIWENATTFVEWLRVINGPDVTNGAFGITLLLVFFGISFIVLKAFETSKALLVSSFASTLIAFYLFGMGILEPHFVIIFGAIFGFSLAFLNQRTE